MQVKEHKRPTLRTIAEMSGFSVPTVSRALSDAPDIRTETKIQVKEIARKIGYVPNRAGLRLRTGKTHIISLVTAPEHDLTDHMGKLISSIGQALAATPYQLTVTPYLIGGDHMAPLRYLVETRSVDAVILNRVQTDDERVRYLMERNFPFVTFGRTRWQKRHAYFDYDNAQFGRLAVDTLVARGRRNMALIAPPLEQNYAQEMMNAAIDAASRHDVRVQQLPGTDGDGPGEQIQSGVADFLTKVPEADGLICPSVACAVAAVVGAESVGREIGRNLDIYAKQAVPFLKHFRRDIQSVSEDMDVAGENLARAAIRAIENPAEPPIQMLDIPR